MVIKRVAGGSREAVNIPEKVRASIMLEGEVYLLFSYLQSLHPFCFSSLFTVLFSDPKEHSSIFSYFF